ncbi:MAG: transketolase family protein [bacterium]|nr:transketolase family protein [bacterium]
MSQGKATRDGFGEGLVELGKTNPAVVALSADLADSTRAEWFQKEFPDRFIEAGIAEQNMVGIAAGLSLVGKIPFASSFGSFLLRPYDHIRVTICYGNLNVKLVATHCGISTGEDGASAQMMEDIAAMRALPGMTVIVPCDAGQAKQATIALASQIGPAYLRLGRAASPVVIAEGQSFEIGKAQILKQGKDVGIIACGMMVAQALEAASILEKEGVVATVVNIHTIKPIDRDAIIDVAKKTGAIVTAEEHQINGGLGSAVAEVLSQLCPVPIAMVAMPDSFGESGKSEELLKKYHLTADDIVIAVRSVMRKK